MKDPSRVDSATTRYLAFIAWGLALGLIAGLILTGVPTIGSSRAAEALVPLTVSGLLGGVVSAVVFFPLLRKSLRGYWMGFPIVGFLLPWVIFAWLNLQAFGSPLGVSLDPVTLVLPMLWSIPLVMLSLVSAAVLYLWQIHHRG